MSSEYAAFEKVLVGNSPLTEAVIANLPREKWLNLRLINKWMKHFIDAKLLELRAFPKLKCWAHKNNEEVYDRLGVMVPNLYELPTGLEAYITRGGFSSLRKLRFNDKPPSPTYDYYAMADRILQRAPVLESLEFRSSWVELAEIILWTDTSFPALKRLHLKWDLQWNHSLPPNFVERFPALEYFNMPKSSLGIRYMNFEKLRELPRLESLRLGEYCGYTPLSALPRLKTILFSDDMARNASSWTEFFKGAENLQTVRFKRSVGRAFLELLALIPCEIQELWLNYIETELILDTFRMPNLANLTSLNVSFKMFEFRENQPLLESFFSAANSHLKNLRSLDIEFWVLPRSNFTFKFDLDLPRLKNFAVYLVIFPVAKNRETNVTVLFGNSSALKNSLERFDLSLATNDYQPHVCFDSLINKFLNGCEKLEQIKFSLFDPVQMMEAKRRISKLNLPKLKIVENVTERTWTKWKR